MRRLRLEPSDAAALPEAVDALERADLIVIGPGSLYSSLVAVLLVRGLPEAIARSRARVVLVMNLMTEPGETDGHTGADHVMAIRRHAPALPIHDVLINTTPLEPAQIAHYDRPQRDAGPGGRAAPTSARSRGRREPSARRGRRRATRSQKLGRALIERVS